MKRPTIGLVLSDLFDDYQISVWTGVYQQAKVMDCNFIGFCGGVINSPDQTDKERNEIYKLISSENIDILLLVTGTLCIYINEQEMLGYFKNASSLPIVSIGIEIPGIPSVIVDNHSGMYDVVSHIVKEHNCKRVAIIKGPDTNEEAVIRFEAYKQVLSENDIPILPELICEGDFADEDGEKGVALLVDERKVTFDALICSDDNTALHAIQSLEKRGISVPGDVIVGGFDDIEEGQYSTPPLTTVRQPLFDLGIKAVELAHKILNKHEVPDIVNLDTNLVVRRSCGCTQREMFRASTEQMTDSIAKFDKEKPLHVTLIDTVIAKQRRKCVEKRQVEFVERNVTMIMFEAIKAFESSSTTYLRSALEKIFSETESVGIEIRYWHGVTSTVLSYLEFVCFTDKNKDFIDELYLDTLDIVAEFEIRSHSFKRIDFLRQIENLHRSSDALVTHFNIDDIKETLRESCDLLDVDSCFLSFYDEDKKYSKLQFAYDKYKKFKMSNDKVYKTSQLIPGGINTDERYSFNVISSIFEEQNVGFIILEMTHVEVILFETLAGKITSAFKGAQLVDTTLSHASDAEKALEIAQNKTLENTLKAGMADIASGVLNDVGNVITDLQTTSQTLRDKLYNSCVNDLNINSLEFKDKLNLEFKLMQKQIDRMIDNLSVIDGVIKTQQIYAGKENFEEMVDLEKVIDDALMIQSECLIKNRIEIKKNYSKTPKIVVQKLKLLQILINLLINSKDAMKNNHEDKREIIINTKCDANTVLINIIDNGCGIQEEDLEKINSFSFTRKNNGYGFGLYSSTNFITEMGGRMWTESEGIGKGASFTLEFPIEREAKN